MTYYTDPNHTPLAFNTFVKCVSLPLGILTTVGELMTLSGGAVPREIEGLAGTVSVVDLVLLVVALVGLVGWRGYGWMALMAHLGLMVIYSLGLVGIYAQYGAESYVLGRLVAALIYGGLVGLYYMKRRYLFFPDEIPAHLERTRMAAAAEEAVCCRHCGQELLPNSLFCSSCGSRVDEEGRE